MGTDRLKRGTRIETRRWTQRPVAWFMPLAYAAAYAGLFSLSSVYWFLPAGLRLAALWMSPRSDWWRLALGDMGAIFLIGLYRGRFDSDLTLLAASVVPWCLYAGIVWRFGRAPAASPTPESMMRFLICGMGASLASAVALTTINAIDDGMPPLLVGAFFNFALGDFIGIIVLAPLLRMFLGLPRGQPVPWKIMFANGVVVLPAALAIGVTMLPVQRIEIYPVVLSSFVLFWIAYRFGWRAGSIALVLLSASTYMSRSE